METPEIHPPKYFSGYVNGCELVKIVYAVHNTGLGLYTYKSHLVETVWGISKNSSSFK